MPRIRRRRIRSAALAFGLLCGAVAPAPGQVGPFSQQETRMDDRTPLAKLVEPINAEVARLVRDPATTVTRMKTPFLQQGLIFYVLWRGPHRPVGLTVGFAQPGHFVVLLAGNPTGFNELVAKAGVRLDTDEQRVAYAVTELESTRRFDETFVVLRSFDDVRLMAGPTPEAEARFQAMRAMYQPRIQPPRSAPDANGWTVPVYVLSRNDLCLFTVSIDHAGQSKIEKAVLEANTPLLPRPPA